jgi:hypothetical protein
LQSPAPDSLKGNRDRAILAVLLGCGLRRREVADLDFAHLQQREEHWAIVDLVGKGGHIRTVPLPEWVKATIDLWGVAAGLSAGRLFRCVCRAGKHWGDGVTERLVWHVVKQYARKIGLTQLAPHDLRRSCAKLCHASGGELDQIQFLLGRVPCRQPNATSAANSDCSEHEHDARAKVAPAQEQKFQLLCFRCVPQIQLTIRAEAMWLSAYRSARKGSRGSHGNVVWPVLGN